MRIDVIVNLAARGYARDPGLLGRVRAAAGGRALVHPTASLAELEQVARDLAARGADVVVLSGGDGTAGAGLTALVRAFGEARLPRVALAPGGTVGTVARNWGVRGAAPGAVARAIDAARAGSATKRATLRVRPLGPDGEPVAPGEASFGFIVGAGLVARFFERYVAAGAGGEAVAAKLALRTFAGALSGSAFAREVLSGQPATVEADGARVDTSRVSLVCAATVRSLGLGLRVAHRAGEDPRRPHLVVASASPFELGLRAARVPLGLPIGGPGSFDGLVERATVRFAGLDAFVLDGDLVRAHGFELTPGPALVGP